MKKLTLSRIGAAALSEMSADEIVADPVRAMEIAQGAMRGAVSVSSARESKEEDDMPLLNASAQVERVAFASSEPENHVGRPTRWTELAVYYDPKPRIPGKPWIAVSRGLSTHPGEETKEERVQVGTLDRALKLFRENSQLGRSVITQAKDWDESNGDWRDGAWRRAQISHGDTVTRPATGTLTRDFTPKTQEEALRWLYGDELEEAKPATLLARDFGAGESTVRAAIAAGREIKIPLLAALRFIDRDAFRRARDGGDNG